MYKIIQNLITKSDDDLFLLSKCKGDINEFFITLSKIKKIDIAFFYSKYPILNIDLKYIFNILSNYIENIESKFSIVTNSPIKPQYLVNIENIYTGNKYINEYYINNSLKCSIVNIEENIKNNNVIYNLLDFSFLYSKKITLDKTYYIKTFDEFLLSKIFEYKKIMFICNKDIISSSIYKYISEKSIVIFHLDFLIIYYEEGVSPFFYKNNQKIYNVYRNNNFIMMDREIIKIKHPEYLLFFNSTQDEIIPFPENYTELKYMIDNLVLQNDILKNLYSLIKNNDDLIEHIINNNNYSILSIKDLILTGLIKYKIKINENINNQCEISIKNNVIKISGKNTHIYEFNKHIKARYIYNSLHNIKNESELNFIKIKIPTIDVLYIINKIIDDNETIFKIIDKTKIIIEKKITSIKEYFNFCVV